MAQSILDEIKQVVTELPTRPNTTMPGLDEVSRMAGVFGRRTEFGSLNYCSSVKILSTALTVYLGSRQVEVGSYTQRKRDIRKSAPETIRQVHRHLKLAPLVELDCSIGCDSDFAPKCSLFLSVYRPENMALAHMIGGSQIGRASCRERV